MRDRRPSPFVRTLLSFVSPRRARPARGEASPLDTHLSDSLERELIEREIRRQRGF